jgi:dihydroorotase
MQNRRDFLRTVTAACVATAGLPRLSAARYELVLKGGRVIDPGSGIDRIMDVAINSARIVAVQSNIPAADAADVIDVRGKLVTPGLVDIHTHVAEPELGPSHCLANGVTSLVDAGSRGADGVEEIVRVANVAPNRVRILLNISRRGQTGDELLDLANADTAAARRAIEANRDTIIGVKARLSTRIAGTRDLDAIRRAHEAAVPLNLPLMVHVGQTASPMPAILALLRPGDIVTHVYAPAPNGILDEEGRVLRQVREARRRGILFDIGHGRNAHITWDVAEAAIRQDFLPDTISSDLTVAGRTDGVFDFPTVLSKFLLVGMPLDRVIATGTVNAARAFAVFKGLGTLKPGAPADVAVFELREGDFEFVDNLSVKRIGHQKLVPFAVVANGTRVA